MFRSMSEFQSCSKAVFRAYCTITDGDTGTMYMDKTGAMCCYYILFGSRLSESLLNSLFYRLSPSNDTLVKSLPLVDETTFLRFVTSCAVHEGSAVIGSFDSPLPESPIEAKQQAILQDKAAWEMFNALSNGKGYFVLEDWVSADRHNLSLADRLVANMSNGSSKEEEERTTTVVETNRRRQLLTHAFFTMDRKHTGRITFSDFQQCVVP